MFGRPMSRRRCGRVGAEFPPPALRRFLLGAMTAVALAASWGGVGQSPSAAADTGTRAASPAGVAGRWNLTFDDEFTGSRSSLQYWSTCYDWACTNAGNDELEWYEGSNVSLSPQGLLLTARVQQAHDKPYTSGMIQSNRRYVFRYGFAEARAKVPAGKGLWSAFWLLPSSQSWPPEIDVMEIYGSSPRVVAMTVHYGSDGSTEQQFVGPNYSAGYHTFGVDWEPGSISWYIDGALRQRVAISINTPMYLLATLAIQGMVPPTRATRFPSAMAIQWIRVFQHPRAGSAN
jgi:beta-glucanase (GH16 family)